MEHRRKKRINRKVVKYKTYAFAAVIGIFALASLLFPLRPKASGLEDRELAKFPKPSVETLWNGEFFEDVSTWYSDTFPFREKLVSGRVKHPRAVSRDMVVQKLKGGLTSGSVDRKGALVDRERLSFDTRKELVALTFDDGPGERTEELLDCLEANDARATFFMVGENIPEYPNALKRMKEIGCELGSHSYDHANLSKCSADELKAELDKTNAAVKEIVGEETSMLRPPYGAIGGEMESLVNAPMILWNIDTLDWKTRSAAKTIEVVMNNTDDGDIVLMHDIHSTSIDAALQLIPALKEKGYELVTVSELAKARGIELQDGVSYTDFNKE